MPYCNIGLLDTYQIRGCEWFLYVFDTDLDIEIILCRETLFEIGFPKFVQVLYGHLSIEL